MKLELKQILQLAANEVVFYCEDTDSGEYEMLNVVNIDLANETIEIGATVFDFEDIGGFTKPILRPLSDLTNEEMEVLRNIMFPKAQQWTKQYWNFIKNVKSFPLLQSYYVVEYLKSIHADIFGLIENNLAIKINDLK